MLQRPAARHEASERRGAEQRPHTAAPDAIAALQQTVGNQATAQLLQRLPGEEEEEVHLASDASAPAGDAVEPPVRSPEARLPLYGTVGPGGDNYPEDVASVRMRLEELGFGTGAFLGGDPGYFDPDLATAILAFQRAEIRAMQHDGIVSPGGRTHCALGIGRQPGAGELDADLEVAVENVDSDAVRQLERRLTEAEELHAACARSYQQELGGERDELVALIGEIRAEIDALAESGLPADEIASVTAWAHRRLNSVGPYYLQGTNADFLDAPGSATRTCNITCLAMCLEALGVSSSSYTGDRDVLLEIRGHRGNASGDYNYAQAFDRAKDVVENDRTTAENDIAGMRLPDFLQLVFVGRLMEQGTSLMDAARSGYDDILDLNKLALVSRSFGVSAYVRPIGMGRRNSDVRQRHVDMFGGLLDQGKQVIASVGGHFVKIENIEDEHLVVNDPATSKKSDRRIPWAEADGYVKSIMAIG